jgi:hypothetical protein
MNVCFGSFVVTQPSFKRMLENVGLPDEFDIRPLNRLPIPSQIHAIPTDSKILGAYATPDLARLMLLCKLLF